MRWILCIVSFAFALAAGGCSSGGYVEVGAKTSALTTPPPPTVRPIVPSRSLVVTVKEVDLVLGDSGTVRGTSGESGDHGDDADEADDADGLRLVTIFSGSRVLDLTDDAAAEAFLGGLSVPTGRVAQVRLVLDGSPVLHLGAQTFAVRCPSCDQSGLKIVPDDEMIVSAGGRLHLTLDFDLDASLVDTASGWLLKPVIHLEGRDLD